MRIDPDLELFEQVFNEPIYPPPNSIRSVNIATIVDILAKAAADCFKIEFEIQPLSDREWLEILKGVTKTDEYRSPVDI
jgi:lipoate---protein ligase